MKKRIFTAIIISVLTCSSAKAELGYDGLTDYTGEAYFLPPSPVADLNTKKSSSREHTVPPVKKLRQAIKNSIKQRAAVNDELAPTPEDVYMGEVETSQYASKEVEENFIDESVSPDGFEADDEAVQELEKKKNKRKDKKAKSKTAAADDIILDCAKVDYDSQNFIVYARGNVNVKFVKQGITLLADVITFDRVNNTVKAEGDVKIVKSGQVVTGEYIFVDLNEENALIEKPIMRTATMLVQSDKGYVYGDKIVQHNGEMVIDKSFPIEFVSAKRTPQVQRLILPQPNNISDDMEHGIIKISAKNIKVDQNGKLEVVSLNKLRINKGQKLIFKTPAVKLYTNKNREFFESDHWEIGSYRGLGVYAGPGFALGMRHGAVLKLMPMLNYKSGLGVGLLGRFNSGTNHTMAAYGSATENLILYGRQELDDNLSLQYSVNGYMDEWFLGRRRPKYGVGITYRDSYSSKGFLIKNQPSSFEHRFEAGYYNDLDFDRHFEKLAGNDLGTARFRYMAQARQSLYSYVNEEERKAFNISLIGQLSNSIYGSGETQTVARFAPNLHTQYKNWMQDVGFYLSAYDDNTPMPVFDAYRYGKQALFLREYLRLNRLLTIAWFGKLTLSNDSPNGKDFQENAFYLSIGPDDFKFNIGYDFIRENLYAGFVVNMDAKGSKIEYEKLEIKKHNREEKSKVVKAPEPKTDFKMSGQPVLRKAVVTRMKETEDVL